MRVDLREMTEPSGWAETDPVRNESKKPAEEPASANRRTAHMQTEWNSTLEVRYDPTLYVLHLWRPTLDTEVIDVVTGVSSTGSFLHEKRRTDTHGEPSGITIPADMLHPIYDALTSHFGRDRSAELDAALKIERRRVDATIQGLISAVGGNIAVEVRGI